jgi:tetratricopeptide (TPR) repeat protein
MEEASTYSNRAMAYLKLKNYSKVLEDANCALKIDKNYLKAYHRRGKAYFELKKYELAIKDF